MGQPYPYRELTCAIWPQNAGELDEELYLLANADVAAAGMTALDHFTQFGHAEGRTQWVRDPSLAEIREAKLSRVRFRRPPTTPRARGAAADYLPPAQAEELKIPSVTPLSANSYGDHLVQFLRDNPDKLYLDLGAGMSPIYFSNVVTTEITPMISTDVVCMGEDLPFESDQFDGVFCFAVLEHTLRPWEVAREICRVLKPGGRAMIGYPFLQPVHGYPHHYFNATPQGVRSLFEPYCDIESVEIGPREGPIFSVAWILHDWRLGLPPDVAEEFDDLRVCDLIRRDKDAQYKERYCQELDPAIEATIAAGSTLTGIKRPVAVPSRSDGEFDLRRENEALRAALATMRESTSWRVTAPLRGLRALLGRS